MTQHAVSAGAKVVGIRLWAWAHYRRRSMLRLYSAHVLCPDKTVILCGCIPR